MALIIGAFCSSQHRLSNHTWVQLSNSRENSGMPGRVPQNGDLALKRHCIEHILSPRAPMALIIGAFCSSQPVLSKLAWVHLSNFRQYYSMPGGVLKHGDLTLKRHSIEHIHPPRARMALIIGVTCSSQPGSFGYTLLKRQFPLKTQCGLENV